ncbi:hypothetical protein AB0E85_14460 [Streptomyces sp. NPDC029044]|uniref:hypothetical protein n=1 Tax=Streptomyces sp. NPDC029044 TaxID=3157198 RepID=UPI00340889A7
MTRTPVAQGSRPRAAFGLSCTAMAVAGTASVFTGRLADRRGSRPAFLAGALLSAASTALRVGHAARSTRGSR